jgi:tripartite-type tricarboxylate transporter receptor subunit TctC
MRIAVALMLAVAALGAQAQSYPSRPVKIIVPFGAGGPADIFARFLGKEMEGPLGQPVIVEDKPGGGSIIGSDAVAKSAPDGYTLLMMSNTHTVNETLIPKKPFVLLRDLAPVAPVNYSDLLLVVHPSVPANNLKELIAYAKREPGKMNYASSGPGTPYHMAGELLKSMAGIDVVHVPHKGSDGARLSILSGQVQMMFDAITTMAPNVRAGKLKGFGTSGRERSSALPEVPTVAEAGVPGYESTIWLGIMAPAGTPKPIIDRLNAEITKVTSRADVREAWSKRGATAMSMTPEQFGQYMRGDIAKWAKVIASAGIKRD